GGGELDGAELVGFGVAVDLVDEGRVDLAEAVLARGVELVEPARERVRARIEREAEVHRLGVRANPELVLVERSQVAVFGGVPARYGALVILPAVGEVTPAVAGIVSLVGRGVPQRLVGQRLRRLESGGGGGLVRVPLVLRVPASPGVDEIDERVIGRREYLHLGGEGFAIGVA